MAGKLARVRGHEPDFFEDEVYEVVREYKALSLFDPSEGEVDFVLVKNNFDMEQELYADSVEFV